jgi:ABC-type Fe3+/spermidine/putrescine transport system ATPase subunit
VADFVGTANLLEGKVAEKYESHLVVNIDDEAIRIEEPDETVDIDDTIITCIRPETIETFAKPPEDTRNIIKGSILNSIFEGAHIRYWVEVGKRILVVDVFDPSEKGVYEGEIFLGLHPGKIHILRGDGQPSDISR